MSLSSAQTAKVVEYYELVHLAVGDGYFLTNAPFNITVTSQGPTAGTYTSFGMLLGFDTIEENSELEIPSLSITISGIAPTSSGSALKDFVGENYANSSVRIDRVYYENHVQQGLNFLQRFKKKSHGKPKQVSSKQKTSTTSVWCE